MKNKIKKDQDFGPILDLGKYAVRSSNHVRTTFWTLAEDMHLGVYLKDGIYTICYQGYCAPIAQYNYREWCNLMGNIDYLILKIFKDSLDMYSDDSPYHSNYKELVLEKEV